MQTTTHEDTKKKYGKILFLIHQCADDIFENIMHCESVKYAWDILEKVYAGDEKLKKVKLHALRIRQYGLLQMIQKEYASQYLNKLFTLTHQMQRNGEKVTDLMKIEKVLRTLTSLFDLICSGHGGIQKS